MLYRSFGKTGWDVSAIGLGTWNIGNQWGPIDETTAWATIRAAFDSGVNLIDTAESYGNPNGLSEMRLGRALAGIRHRVYVVTKIGHWGKRSGEGVPKTTADLIRLCGHACLGRLRTDWLDVVLCHESNIETPDVYLAGFEALKAEGSVREYGISTNSLDVLRRFNVNDTCGVVEVNYSLLNRAAEKDLLPYCVEHGIAVLVRGPLRKGLLSGKYDTSSRFEDSVRTGWNPGADNRSEFETEIARVGRLSRKVSPGEDMVTAALRYVISHEACPVAIPGAKSPEQARMNAAAGAKTLSDGEAAELCKLLEAS